MRIAVLHDIRGKKKQEAEGSESEKLGIKPYF